MHIIVSISKFSTFSSPFKHKYASPLYSAINLFKICILTVMETTIAKCSHEALEASAIWTTVMRVSIVTGAGGRWKMMRMSLPCESRWACMPASWAARKTSSPAPGAPATEPTTPPALLRSPVTCHEPRPAKINQRPINLNMTLDVLFARYRKLLSN